MELTWWDLRHIVDGVDAAVRCIIRSGCGDLVSFDVINIGRSCLTFYGCCRVAAVLRRTLFEPSSKW